MELCSKILNLDGNIRWLALIDDIGDISMFKKRKSWKRKLDENELEIAVFLTTTRRDSRRRMEEKFGIELYTITAYQKANWICIPCKKELMLVAMLDNMIDPRSVVKKIIRYLNNTAT